MTRLRPPIKYCRAWLISAIDTVWAATTTALLFPTLSYLEVNPALPLLAAGSPKDSLAKLGNEASDRLSDDLLYYITLYQVCVGYFGVLMYPVTSPDPGYRIEDRTPDKTRCRPWWCLQGRRHSRPEPDIKFLHAVFKSLIARGAEADRIADYGEVLEQILVPKSLIWMWERLCFLPLRPSLMLRTWLIEVRRPNGDSED